MKGIDLAILVLVILNTVAIVVGVVVLVRQARVLEAYAPLLEEEARKTRHTVKNLTAALRIREDGNGPDDGVLVRLDS